MSLRQNPLLKRYQVLTVDDEPNILSAMRRFLQAKGFEVRTAQSGKEGLELLAAQKADIIISDMRMPEMTGAQFLMLARQKWPNSLRILLTGYADMASTIKAVNDGEIFRYLSKPWDDTLLEQTLQEAVHRIELERERDELRRLTKKQNEDLVQLNGGLEVLVEQRTAELKKAHDQLAQAAERLKTDFAGTAKLLSSLVDARAGLTAQVPRRVSRWIRDVAPQVGLLGEALSATMFAALLQDLGKISLSDALISQPLNLLTPEQRQQFLTHPQAARSYLMSLTSLNRAGEVLGHLYENFDGSGVPQGLKGNDIPLAARLLRVATDYEHLRVGAIEIDPLSEQQAYNWLRKHRGSLYDPRCVDAYLQVRHQPLSSVPSKRLVSTADLKAGMRLAEDLSGGGTLLLAQDHELDARLIEHIREFERVCGSFLWVSVLDPVSPEPATSAADQAALVN